MPLIFHMKPLFYWECRHTKSCQAVEGGVCKCQPREQQLFHSTGPIHNITCKIYPHPTPHEGIYKDCFIEQSLLCQIKAHCPGLACPQASRWSHLLAQYQKVQLESCQNYICNTPNILAWFSSFSLKIPTGVMNNLYCSNTRLNVNKYLVVAPVAFQDRKSGRSKKWPAFSQQMLRSFW